MSVCFMYAAWSPISSQIYNVDNKNENIIFYELWLSMYDATYRNG